MGGGGEVLVGDGGGVSAGGGAGVASGIAVAVGSLMGVAAVAALVGSGSMERTIGVDGGLAGTDAAFCVGSGSDGDVEAVGPPESVSKASDHQPPSRVPGPDRT